MDTETTGITRKERNVAVNIGEDLTGGGRARGAGARDDTIGDMVLNRLTAAPVADDIGSDLVLLMEPVHLRHFGLILKTAQITTDGRRPISWHT